MRADRRVDPSATTFVMVRFFGASGVANAREPFISAPSAGRSGTSSKSVAFIVYAERSEASPVTPVLSSRYDRRPFVASLLRVDLPTQRPRLIDIDRALQPVHLNDDCQTDGGFSGGDGDDEDREDLSLERREAMRERHEVDVHRVHHQLDAHEYCDHVPAQDDADETDREECPGKHEIGFRARHSSPP